MKKIIFGLLLLGIFLFSFGNVNAVAYTTCGQAVSSNNLYTLSGNINTSAFVGCVDMRSVNNVTFDCQNNIINGSTDEGWAFYVGATSNSTIQNCNSFSLDFFVFHNGGANTNLTIRNNNVTGMDNNFMGSVIGDKIYVINNTIIDGAQSQISVSTAGIWNNSIIRGNTFYRPSANNAWNFQTSRDVNNLTIENNTIRNNVFTNFQFQGNTTNLLIRNNLFYNLTSSSEYANIYIDSANNEVSNVEVSNNNFTSVKRAFITINTPRKSSNITLKNNLFTNPINISMTAVEFSNYYNNVTIKDNILTGNYTRIIYAPNTSNLLFSNNTIGTSALYSNSIIGETQFMLFVGGRNNIIENNTAYLNAVDGIYYSVNTTILASTNNLTIQNNKIVFNDVNNGRYGIRTGDEVISSGVSMTNVTVRGNNVTSLLNCNGCARHSYLLGAVTNSLFYDNYAYGGAYSYVIKDNTNTSVYNNTGYYPINRAILDKGTHNGIFYNNYLYGDINTPALLSSQADDYGRNSTNHSSYNNLISLTALNFSGGGSTEGITIFSNPVNPYRDNNTYVIANLTIARFGANGTYFTPSNWADNSTFDANSRYCIMSLDNCWSWDDTSKSFDPTSDNTLNIPILHLKFNENNGTTTYDISGNGNNGTITGATYGNDGILVALTSGVDFLLSGTTFTLTNDFWSWNYLNVQYQYSLATLNNEFIDVSNSISNGVSGFFSNASVWFALLGVVVIILIISIVIVAVNRFNFGNQSL